MGSIRNLAPLEPLDKCFMNFRFDIVKNSFNASSNTNYHMFAISSDIIDAWVGLQSFVLTTYMFIYTFVDFILNLILPLEKKRYDTNYDEYVSDSGDRSKRHRLRRLRKKISSRHPSPSTSRPSSPHPPSP